MRSIEITPFADLRDADDPANSKGLRSPVITFRTGTALKEVAFNIATNWYPEEITIDFLQKQILGILRPAPRNVTWNDNGGLPAGGSTMTMSGTIEDSADLAFGALLSGGLDTLWSYLEQLFAERFPTDLAALRIDTISPTPTVKTESAPSVSAAQLDKTHDLLWLDDRYGRITDGRGHAYDRCPCSAGYIIPADGVFVDDSGHTHRRDECLRERKGGDLASAVKIIQDDSLGMDSGTRIAVDKAAPGGDKARIGVYSGGRQFWFCADCSDHVGTLMRFVSR